MSDNGSIGPERGSAYARAGVCPYLGWYADPDTQHAYASVANHCHTEDPPLTIELSYQTSTCLKGGWTSCPRFKAAQGDDVVGQPAGIPRLGAWPRLSGWAIAGAALVVIAVSVGLFLLFGPFRGYGPFAPTEAVAVAPTAPTAIQAATEEPTQAASPTASQTALPTASPAPVLSATADQPPGESTTPTRTRLPGEWTSPTPTSTATLVNPPSPTPSSTPIPSPTPTIEPTPTPTPTTTPTREPTVTPVPTPTQTRTPRPKPTKPPPTPTKIPAPVLRSPPDGDVYSFRDEVVLEWEPVGQLAADEFYVPIVERTQWGNQVLDETPWTKETQWRMSDHEYLLEYSDDGEFRWAVQVMRRTGTNEKGRPEGTPRSPMSEVRTLIWKKKGESDGAGPPPP